MYAFSPRLHSMQAGIHTVDGRIVDSDVHAPYLSILIRLPLSIMPFCGMQAQCGIFIGPYGAYVRDLLPGEPTDEELLSNEEAARVYYQELWSSNESKFSESASKVRARLASDVQTCRLGGREVESAERALQVPDEAVGSSLSLCVSSMGMS